MWSAGTAKFSIRQFLYLMFTITWSGCLAEICLYLNFPEKFLCLILQDRLRVVHIPLVCMVKFKFLAQFLLDRPLHPVVSSLIVFLSKFVTFAYYVINRFVSIPTQLLLLLLLLLLIQIVYAQFYGWLVGWLVLWRINLCRSFNAKSIFIRIISSISNNSV